MKSLIDICLSFPEVTESPHFHKTSYLVKKKIFATYDSNKHELVVKLSLIDQSVFCDMLPEIIYAVPGGWGKKGWTIIKVNDINEEALIDVLKTAYTEVAPKKLSKRVH